MAVIWVDSAATGAADGTSYTDAYTTLGAAAGVDVAGDFIYVVSTHSEAPGVVTYNFVDAVIYCVNSLGVRTLPTAFNIAGTEDITIVGTVSIHDLWLSVDDDLITCATRLKWYGGKITVDAAITGSWLMGGAGYNDYAKLYNTTIDLVGGRFYTNGIYGAFELYGCSIAGTGADIFYDNAAVRGARYTCVACDFSAHTATTLVTLVVSGASYTFDRCELPAGITVNSTALTYRLTEINTNSEDSVSFNDVDGVVAEETGIYRTAGAELSGAVGFSLEMITNANASYSNPRAAYLGSTQLDTADFTTTVTATVHFAVDGSIVALDDDEFWFELEFTNGANIFACTTADNKGHPLATATSPTTETGLWTGLGGTNKQMSISKTLTIGTTAGTIASGLVRVKAHLSKPSQVVFVCPQVEFS